MVETVKWETLRELAAFRAELGCAISLFLNLDPSVSPTAADAETRLHSLLGTGERSDGAAREHLDHEAREALKADLERIRGYVENEFDRTGVQGLAIFAAGLDGVWRPLPLVKPVADGVSVGSTFALAPLVGHLDTREALVAVISREHGELFRVDDGRLEEVVDKSEEVPRRHDQGGRSQARFQRHVDEVSAEHLRTVADELNRQIRAVDDPDLVIVCPEPIRSTVETLLAKEAKDALAGWASAEAHARPAELFEIVQPLLEEARSRREAGALERWREEAGRDGRASAGWAQTLEAASDSRVDLLLFSEGVQHRAWQCPDCGRLAAQEGACPLDGAAMERSEEGLDLAIHQTLAQGGRVWAVQHHSDLDPLEGIGALLRF